MNNEYTAEIKRIMTNFTDEDIPKDYPLEDLKELKGSQIPLNPDLMLYLFKHILMFHVPERIFEKVNYIIDFKFKGFYGRVGHFKLSYRLSLDSNIEDEVITILNDVKILIEQAFLEYSDYAVKNNKYSLPNYYHLYNSKIELLEANLNKLKQEMDDLEVDHEIKKQTLIENGTAYNHIEIKKERYSEIVTPLSQLNNDFRIKNKELTDVFSYTCEYYLECVFSFIDHVCSLLYPMTDLYDQSEEYSNFLNKDWRVKIETMLPLSIQSNKEIIDRLSYFKQVYRNRFSHGMFSKEKKINVQIDNFGMYPLWIGSKVRGFSGTSSILDMEIFQDFHRLFNEAILNLKNSYPLHINIIEAGIPTFLDKDFYDNAFIDSQSNEKYIESYWYHQDNLINMDW